MDIINASILFWKPFSEIIILWFLIYRIMLFFEDTRAVYALRGIIILLVAFVLFKQLDFEVMEWLFTKLFGISVLAVLIIFHPEIRQGLAKLGRQHLIGPVLKAEEWDYVLIQIGKAADDLSKEKIGALIAIEKNDSLSAYIQSGVNIDAHISSELIGTIFNPKSILHDGGMVVRQDRIIAAGCLFPLTENQELSRIFGTRHRAALGLSEETDALIIAVSEERQDVTLFYKAKMYKDLSREELISKIREIVTQ